MLNTIKSYAKINLFLNVVNKLDTGFHELNSVLSRIDLYDEIRIKDESSFSISYNGPFGDQVGSNDHISKLFKLIAAPTAGIFLSDPRLFNKLSYLPPLAISLFDELYISNTTPE